MFKKYFDQYQSQQDQDYNPTKQQQAIYKLEHQKKKRIGLRRFSVNDLWHELQQEHRNNLQKAKNFNGKKIKLNQGQQQSINKQIQSKNKAQQQKDLSALQLAQNIMNSESIKPDKRIIFAGKQFIMNQQTGQLEIAQKIKPLNFAQLLQIQKEQDSLIIQQKKTKIAYQYLNHVMRTIYNRSRKINSIGKSKIDWKGFVKQQGIQHKLNYNRKGGVIQDMQFIKNTSK